MKNVWIGSVDRRLRGAYGSKPLGDFGHVFQQEMEDYYEPTNQLRHIPPTQNNVAYYRGTFDSREGALAEIKTGFPDAQVTVIKEQPAKPLKMGRVFYSGSERFEGFGGLGWYYEIGMAEPVGPFELEDDARVSAQVAAGFRG